MLLGVLCVLFLVETFVVWICYCIPAAERMVSEQVYDCVGLCCQQLHKPECVFGGRHMWKEIRAYIACGSSISVPTIGMPVFLPASLPSA